VRLRCRLGRHLWVVDRATRQRSCLYCGKTAKAGADLRCHVGIHHWAPAVADDGTRHLACSRCNKYGGEPHSLVPWPGERG
jgi:hypothetical protein